MSKYSEAGKGSKQRPTDPNAYAKGWDIIFSKKKNGNENKREKNKSK